MDRSAIATATRRLRETAVTSVFTTTMARAAGFTDSAIRHRIRSGAWLHVAGSGYVDVSQRLHEPTSVYRRAVAASLTWPGVVVCLSTAGLLHGLPITDDGVAHVTVSGARRHRPGLVPHWFELAPHETRPMASFDITTVERTALDLLMWLPPVEAESLLTWIRTREILTAQALEEAMAARAGRRGMRQLRRLTRMSAQGALSELERALHRLLRKARIGGWEANATIVVGGRILARVDVLFAAERLIIETDGRAYHDDFERERARLNALTLAGYTVLRFTWSQVHHQSHDVIWQIRAALKLSA